MAHHHKANENPLYYDTLDQWICIVCSKPVSASRPPVFNPDNCCCADAGAHADGHGRPIQESPYDQIFNQYEPAPQYHIPESQNSSNVSVPCPEGPERSPPNMRITNSFLPLSPEPGLNESETRFLISFHSNVPYSIEQFLRSPDDRYDDVDTDAIFPPPTEVTSAQSDLHHHRSQYQHQHQQPKMQFISQAVHLQAQAHASMRKNPGSRRSRRSGAKSAPSSWTGEASAWSWSVDPVTGVGSWIDEEGNLFCAGEGGYPEMAMSGLTEWAG